MTDPQAGQPSPGPGQGTGHPRHPGAPRPGQAGIGSIFVLAFIVILVPGVLVYLVSHALGLALGPASLLGLLTVIVCLGCYPSVLVRLGWVRRRSRRR
ncbi:hypothetical protein [Pseudofrankia asymbiotica]|uniref:Uncharacterized protein n=1 Tax=Pseudofrankia asymbiotica TaxID=1834516 RepID=A0A1V2IAE5_9ACTN|nr:hypothetical protein [Pseudofrankia asymbiotica]ONH29866.1 hypothetical protein BL253_15380 [Pseudofrankia asymbiotica]